MHQFKLPRRLLVLHLRLEPALPVSVIERFAGLDPISNSPVQRLLSPKLIRQTRNIFEMGFGSSTCCCGNLRTVFDRLALAARQFFVGSPLARHHVSQLPLSRDLRLNIGSITIFTAAVRV